MMRPVRIRCKREVIERFKTAALAAHSKEISAILLGRRRGNRVTVRDLWFPDGQRNTTGEVVYLTSRKQRLAEAEAVCESEGVEILGDIHSHTGERRTQIEDASASEYDLKRREGQYWITGVCVVVKTKRGKAYARVRFWPWMQRVKLTIEK